MNILHPPFVHFVVALPVAALFAQLTYLATGERTYAKVALRILAFTLLMGLFALYTGNVDAEKLQGTKELTGAAAQLLESHRSFGIWLLGILGLTIVVKWIAAAKASHSWEKLALLGILVTIAATLYQGNRGGELVYRYGAGVNPKSLQQSVTPSQPKE